jgi:enoyl-CoA hydratase
MRDDPAVRLILIDAAGDRAFCAGGDIARLYAEARAGNFTHGRDFWRDEYRMNDRIAEYPKPVVSLMQGFTMGGGVGVGCHASHRIVGESAQIAMPECGIGLVPDVGGSYLLARAPGHLGAWLGMAGARMGPGAAIFAGFADRFVPEAAWPALTAELVTNGDPTRIAAFARPAPTGRFPALMAEIDAAFATGTVPEIVARLSAAGTAFAGETLEALARVSPLATACALEMQRRLKPGPTIRAALDLEYRFTWRAQDQSDFLEGIRAQIIDKDRAPRWRHASHAAVTQAEIETLLSPLGPNALTFEE